MSVLRQKITTDTHIIQKTQVMLSENFKKTISCHEAEDYFDIVGFLNPCATLVQMYVCLKMNQIKDNSLQKY